MKKLYISSVFTILLALCCVNSAYAGFGVGACKLIWRTISHDQMIIQKTIDLPNTNEFKYDEKVYLDIGVKFNSRKLFWLIPIWNSEVEYVGYIDSDKDYLELSRNQLEQVTNIKLPENPTLPYWYSYGGKILFLIIVGLLIHLWMVSKGD